MGFWILVEFCLFNQRQIISPTCLVAPIIEVGFTALSVEIITKRCTLLATERSAMICVPNTLFRIASTGEIAFHHGRRTPVADTLDRPPLEHRLTA